MGLFFGIILTYLLGALPFGYLAGRFRGIDLRQQGSGSTGATNVFRTLGHGLALVVLLLDMAKGVSAAFLGKVLLGLDPGWGAAVGGMLAIIGHCYSVFLGFKGGKGAATSAGVFLVLAPYAIGLGIAAYALVTLATRYSSLGTLTGMVVGIIAVFLLEHPLPHRGAAVLAAIFIVYKHRENIGRLLTGKELRLGGKSK